MEILVIFLVIGVAVWLFVMRSSEVKVYDEKAIDSLVLGISNDIDEISLDRYALMERLAAPAIKAAKAKNVQLEAELTRLAFDEFVALEMSKTYEPMLDSYEKAVSEKEKAEAARRQYNLDTAKSWNIAATNLDEQEVGLPPYPDLADHLFSARRLAASLIVSLEENGVLKKDAPVKAFLHGATLASSIVLRKDRICWGWEAGKITPQTTVTLNEDGAKQLLQTSSRTEYSGSSSTRHAEGSGTNFANSYSSHSGTASTVNFFSKFDNRSAQIVVTDPGWQAVVKFEASQVDDARAFVDAMRVHLSTNFSASHKELKTPDKTVAVIDSQAKDLTKELAKLKKLHDQGVLTKSEFALAKKKLLS